MKIYHQLGHNYNWNLESFQKDKVGDGLIISPRSMKRDKLIELSNEIRSCSIFDPQFFLPKTQRGYLSSYDFFPDIVADGFETSQYPGSTAESSAQKCVAFQASNNFRSIVIPTRYLPGLPANYQSMQQIMFVNPFLRECQQSSNRKPVLLQLVLNEHMLKDEQYSNNLLNWITSIREIQGVYLILEKSGNSKQIKDLDLLYAFLIFIDNLKQNELSVVIGYLNVESYLLSIAAPDILTIGSYETTRMFNIKNFQEQDASKMRGPNPRIYVPQLLQIIDYNYVNAMRRSVLDGDSLFDQNQYKALMFQPTYKWHFSKPELYKDYFLVFSNQLRRLEGLDGRDRFEHVSQSLSKAIQIFADIESKGVVLDPDSDGSHLRLWLTAANQFAQTKGWR